MEIKSKVFSIYENSDADAIIRQTIISLWEEILRIKNFLLEGLPDLKEKKAESVAINKVLEEFEIHTIDKDSDNEKLKEPYKELLIEFFECGLSKEQIKDVLLGTFKES